MEIFHPRASPACKRELLPIPFSTLSLSTIKLIIMKRNFPRFPFPGNLSLLGCLLLLSLVINSCKKVQEKLVPAEVQSKSNNLSQDMKQVDIQLIADNFVSPIGVLSLPDRDGKFDDREDDHDRRSGDDRRKEDKRLFVIDQIGKIWIIDANGNKLPVPFLDLTSKILPLSPGYDERGLLGLAFHPDYKKNGRFFVYYTAPPRAGGPQPGGVWNNLSRISEFRVSAMNPNLADMSFERPLLEINDPQS